MSKVTLSLRLWEFCFLMLPERDPMNLLSGKWFIQCEVIEKKTYEGVTFMKEDFFKNKACAQRWLICWQRSILNSKRSSSITFPRWALTFPKWLASIGGSTMTSNRRILAKMACLCFMSLFKWWMVWSTKETHPMFKQFLSLPLLKNFKIYSQRCAMQWKKLIGCFSPTHRAIKTDMLLVYG